MFSGVSMVDSICTTLGWKLRRSYTGHCVSEADFGLNCRRSVFLGNRGLKTLGVRLGFCASLLDHDSSSCIEACHNSGLRHGYCNTASIDPSCVITN